tara:strand:- start:3425 stop:4375 length:951 start_codon:yes stop_codon:yes gene_type:complete
VSSVLQCIELFAGAGGAALGLESAGIHHAALCEWDPSACATMRAAGLGPVVEGDVRDLDAIEAAAGPGPIDLLWSSFPCQAFSTAGKRLGASDERNGWPWTVDAIDRFRPRWLLGENVRGLLCHSSEGHPDPMKCPRCYLDGVIMPQLRERFAYAGWWLLDAADYGVPQHRRRVFLWAGPAPLRAPRPTHASPATLDQGGLFGPRLLPWVSMGEALDLSDLVVLAAPSRAVTCSEVKGSGANANPEKHQRASDALYLATGRRRLTVEECARLQDFSADHPWQGTKTARYRQVGNAVPPTLARVVVEVVLAANCTHS